MCCRTGCPSRAKGNQFSAPIATAQGCFLMAAGSCHGYFLSGWRTAGLRLSRTATASRCAEFGSSRAAASCRFAPEPAFLSCAWYEPSADPGLVFGVTDRRAAISQGSVPSKWSGLTSDCALQDGAKNSRAPKPTTNTGIFNKLNGFTRDPQFVVLTQTQGGYYSREGSRSLRIL